MPFELRFEDFADGPALSFARVPWDSELLGFDVVEVRLREENPVAAGEILANWLRSRAPTSPFLIYTRTEAGNVTLGEELVHRGFYPVELTYEISLPLHRLESVAPGWKPRARLRLAEQSDLPSLLSIAGSAFGLDRYHLDPHIPASRADARFASWIADGMKAGDPIFVYEEVKRSEILGFLHWRSIGKKTVDISLAAIQPRFQGTGVGVSMYEAALRECQARGHGSAITRISAANLAVVNLFGRLGFAFRSARMTWHHYRQT